MAGGNMSPRMKMISLMYLVFIAMLALNMSKEVLSAFGLMNEKFDDANKHQLEFNKNLLGALETKAADDPVRFKASYDKAKAVEKVSNEFFNFLGKIKTEIESGFERNEQGKLPYESMDKSNIDDGEASWFAGDGYSPKGKAIEDAFKNYREGIVKALGFKDEKDAGKYQPLYKDLINKFNTDDVTDGEGIKKKYFDYHFKGFPSIASAAKLGALQNDIRKIEEGVYNIEMGNTLKQAASFKNYNAIVIAEKSAFFQGEQFKGKVVLGRYDKSTVPSKVVVNGATLNLDTALQDGQVNIGFNAGNIGEHDITGKFTFMEDGKPVDIDIKGNYVVVPKPNSANISADKMNVVYRGVPNPMTITFAGISADKVTANAPGLTKGAKPGAFILNPGSGTTVMINVVGELPDKSKVTDKREFRIKGIPSPTGKIRGETEAKGPKSSLEVSKVTATLEDFDFPVNVVVKQFSIKVPGSPTVVVTGGGSMNGAALNAIKKAQKGDVVSITDIKVEYTGINQAAKKVAPCTFEII